MPQREPSYPTAVSEEGSPQENNLDAEFPPTVIDSKPSSSRYGLVDYDELIRMYSANLAHRVSSSVLDLDEVDFEAIKGFLTMEDPSYLASPSDVADGVVVHFLLLTADRKFVSVEVRRISL